MKLESATSQGTDQWALTLILLTLMTVEVPILLELLCPNIELICCCLSPRCYSCSPPRLPWPRLTCNVENTWFPCPGVHFWFSGLCSEHP